MNAMDTLTIALLTLPVLMLLGGWGLFLFGRRQRQRREHVEARLRAKWEHSVQQLGRFTFLPYHPIQTRRPPRWLAVRTRDPYQVQLALGLRNPQARSWSNRVFSEEKLFIAPPFNGWVLVFGTGLPIPDDDVDACFRFLLRLGRQLGQVQFFQADPVLQHHAWVQVEFGRIRRAYAWAGNTLWNQGVKTDAEIELGMNCFAYGDDSQSDDWAMADHLVANVEKVPQLARRWSLDPADLDGRLLLQKPGIAGDAARI